MTSRHYVMSSKDVEEFKYCPYCAEEIMQVYPGDYAGFIQCSECEQHVGFYIMEEMIERYPSWLIDVIVEPYKEEIMRITSRQNGEEDEV